VSVVTYLLEIGAAKSWRRESAWWTIGLAVGAVSASSVPWKHEALVTTIRTIYSTKKEEDGVGVGAWTPDKVAMTLKLQTLAADHDWEGTLAPAFKGRNAFTRANLASLGRIMKVSSLRYFRSRVGVAHVSIARKTKTLTFRT
jgi:DNA polymerase phi